MAVLLVLSVSLLFFRFVTVKMLPFDNKSEFQVIVNTPEGTTLEQTTIIAQEMGAALEDVPEGTNYQIHAGTSGPYNFNGLVRHYFLRRGPNVADLQVNLVPKHDRKAKSHDVAKCVRPILTEIARARGARIEVADRVPPGPPVLQTLVAEIYGPDRERQTEIGREVLRIFDTTEGVVDADSYTEDPQPEYRLVVDKEKAAMESMDWVDTASAVKSPVA